MSQPPLSDQAPVYRLYALGPPRLVDAQGYAISGMGPGKPLAMLSYLAINGSAQREELVALLWPEMPEDRARNAFRQTLHRVRGALGHDVLRTDREIISANVGERLWCDAIEFQRAASADPRRATDLYRGPFLGGLNIGAAPFEQWAEEQRERFEAQYRGALAAAVDRALESGEKDQAIEFARLLSRVAPLDPHAAVLEAKVLVAGGRRPEAISVLTQHTARIESELGSKPGAVVSTLLSRLVSDAPAVGGAATSDLLLEAEFVGRDRDLGKLLGLWRGIEQRGATAIITGPPGIGKTRLLRELAQRISALGPLLLLWGQERHGNRAIPYAALADALRPAVNAPGVAGASQHLLAEAARLLPEIRDQFNLPNSPPLDDDAARIRFFDGVVALIDAVAFEQAVCIVIEDLHHASKSSIELLHFLTQRLAGAPVLFLLSFRAADAPAYLLERFASRATGGSRVLSTGDGDISADVILNPLEGEAVERLLASVLTPGELDTETLSSVVATSEGNPFRALDLVRRVRRGEPISKLPVELSQALWIRLQSCSPQEQRLFLASALLGRPGSLRLLAAATHLPEASVFDAALALEQRGLIVQQRGGVAPAHDVLAAIALEGTGSAGRALLAGWTADALVADAGSSNAELAQLYSEAGQPSSAHRYAKAAILDAAASGADEELDNLIALAALTATNNADRIGVQSLRTAVRGDSRRLRSGDATIGDKPRESGIGAAEAIEPVTGREPPAPRAPTGTPSSHWSRAGVWRWMTDRPGQIAAVALVAALTSAAVMQGRNGRSDARGSVISDSVIVSERIGARESRQYVVTGSIVPFPTMQEVPGPNQPAWIGKLALPWINPRLSPNGRFVALEKIATQGTSVHIVGADRRDTIPLTATPGDNLAAGWSPDERWLLVIQGTSEGSAYRSKLFAYSVSEPGLRVAIDTASDHAVVDAVWSPSGMRVAWTARIGPSRQQDIFVGNSDGTEARNVTANDGEEYHPTWSPDGELLVFTSDRGSDAEIYSLELATRDLRRLTFNPGQDDRALFSPDGDFIAFESTRGGHVGVYAMPPLGGSARSLTPMDRNFELVRWFGRVPPYLAELRVAVPTALASGGRAVATATALDQYGSAMSLQAIEWESLDKSIELRAIAAALPTSRSTSATLIARAAGFARIVAKAGSWRADTAFTMVGDSLRLLAEGFDDGLPSARWTLLGDPRPVIATSAGFGGGAGLVLRSGRQWESGVLGTNLIPLRRGLSLSARVRAPFSTAGQPGGFTIALVAAEARDAIDQSAPQFFKVAALSWLSQAGRLAYSAEREYWSEAVQFGRGDDWYSFRIEVEADGRIAFYVEDRLRRRSSIVVAGESAETLVQLWIAGRGTGDDVVVDEVRVRLAGEQ